MKKVVLYSKDDNIKHLNFNDQLKMTIHYMKEKHIFYDNIHHFLNFNQVNHNIRDFFYFMTSNPKVKSYNCTFSYPFDILFYILYNENQDLKTSMKAFNINRNFFKFIRFIDEVYGITYKKQNRLINKIINKFFKKT